MNKLYYVLFSTVLLSNTHVFPIWTEYRITTSPANQSNPVIEGNMIVWQDYRHVGSDIYAASIDDPNNPFEYSVSTHENAESTPTIGGDFIFYTRRKFCTVHTSSIEYGIYAYNFITHSTSEITPPCSKSSSGGTGGKIGGADQTTMVWIRDNWIKGYDIETDSLFQISYTYGDTYSTPDISNNIVVWEDYRNANSDIYGFNLRSWEVFPICLNSGTQDYPTISGNIAVWRDYRNGNSDIYGADISNPNSPVEFVICQNEYEQLYPDISGNTIVWQDSRNGNADIFGYDISTQNEFQITDNSANQQFPAISGHTVVWEDDRNGHRDIYATILYGPEVPMCTSELLGDLNDDCKVDFDDFVLFSTNWLKCNLEPQENCWN